MRIKFLLLYFVILCAGCTTYKNISDTDLIGSFSGLSKGKIQGSNTHYDLELKKGNDFFLSIKGHDFSPKCNGTWELRNDTLFLKCDNTETITQKLSNGYMNQREFILKVQNKNKLLLGKLILSRD